MDYPAKTNFLIVSMNKKAAIFLRNSLNDVFEGIINISAFSFFDDEKEQLYQYLDENPSWSWPQV